LQDSLPLVGSDVFMLRALANPFRLISMLPTRPREFWDRAFSIASSRWEAGRAKREWYSKTNMRLAARVLSEVLDASFDDKFLEPALMEICARVCQEQSSCSDGAFLASYSGDSVLAAFCYAITRSLRPRKVVETGVCYGVTSSYILKALETNGQGHLDSIDFPPLGKDADSQVGRFIPQELRIRWTLHRGMSARLLRPLLKQLGSIDLFVHDSLHTYRNMRDEFATAWPYLRPGGVLVSDDVEGNVAFLELASRPDVAATVVVAEQEKDTLLGIAIKDSKVECAAGSE
jgi:predicted O-methyltransferase YrrM